MKYIHPSSWLLLVMVILLGTTTIFAVAGFTTINEKRATLTDLYQIKTDILQANIALRNAIIAENPKEIEFELAKMLITRKSADGIYARLETGRLIPPELEIFKDMQNERPVYREVQLLVVKYTKLNENSLAWSAMARYEYLMQKYLDHVTAITAAVVARADAAYQRTVAEMLLVLSLGTMTVGLVFWRVFR